MKGAYDKMKTKFKLAAVLLCLVYILAANPADKKSSALGAETDIKKEEQMRAVWAATNFGLDFPKTPSSNPNSLKSELNALVNSAKDLNFNTIFFQVRPSGDAFYKSELYPWSKYLTGAEGKAPDGNFDPLEYIIKISHEKNIKIHAWINPYRLPDADGSALSVEANHPDWVINADGKKYLNPGIPEVNDFIANGAAEIARNYQIDGIQIDDYFYPEGNFPDDWSFGHYGAGFSDKAAWRRNNINSLIEKMNTAIKKENKDVLFGVSPQGIWANAKNLEGGSETSGKEAYFSACADTKKWVSESLIDYIIPQIYWNIGYAGADFKTLASWWNNAAIGSKTKLYIGMAVYKAADCTDPESIWYKKSGAAELEKQASLLAGLKNVCGTAMYRMESVLKSEDIKNSAKAINSGEISVFYDLADYPWAKDDILFLYEKNILSGMGDGTFGAGLNVTRGQFAVMLSRVCGKKANFKDNFSDVEQESYYYNEIGSLKALGLINGVSGNKFNPGGEITRQDMAVMTWRILSSDGILSAPKAKKAFSDSAQIAPYAEDAVYALCEEKLLNGYEDGTFKPKNNATRAECGVFLRRIYDIMSNRLEKSEK